MTHRLFASALLALGCAGAGRAPEPAPPAPPAAAGKAAAPAPRSEAFDVLGSHDAARAAAGIIGARATSLLGLRTPAGDLAWTWTFEGGGQAAEVAAGPGGAEVRWRGRREHARAPGALEVAALRLRPADLPRLAGGRPIASALLSAGGPPGLHPRWTLQLVSGERIDAEADAATE